MKSVYSIGQPTWFSLRLYLFDLYGLRRSRSGWLMVVACWKQECKKRAVGFLWAPWFPSVLEATGGPFCQFQGFLSICWICVVCGTSWLRKPVALSIDANIDTQIYVGQGCLFTVFWGAQDFCEFRVIFICSQAFILRALGGNCCFKVGAWKQMQKV